MESKVRCYAYDEINDDLLKQFSEGNKTLENLLRFCYQNKVETRACCIGHEKEESLKTPYIAFVNSDEQNYIVESLINRLFSHGKFKDYIEIRINEDTSTIRLNTFDDELRDEFFSDVERIICDSVLNNVNEPGIYEGLFEAYKHSNLNNNVVFNINHEGLRILEYEKAFFLPKDGELLEIPEEQAMILSESQDIVCTSVVSRTYPVNTNEIEGFITNKSQTFIK